MTSSESSAEKEKARQEKAAEAEAVSGLVLLALLAQAADRSTPDWIMRRVEHLDFLDTRAVRWRVSIDFEVPKKAPKVTVGRAKLRLVPVTTLPKGDLVSFDLRDECGQAIWMPTADQTDRRIAPAMVIWARDILGAEQLPGSMEQDLMHIVASDPAQHEAEFLPFAFASAGISLKQRQDELPEAFKQLRNARFWRPRKWLQAYQTWRAVLQRVAVAQREFQRLEHERGDDWDDKVWDAARHLMDRVEFRNQLQELRRSYIVCVGVESIPGTRRIIKLASERSVSWARGNLWKRIAQRSGLRCWRLNILIGGRGGSHHMEVAAPPGVDVVRIVARPNDPGPGDPETEGLVPIRTVGFSPHVHIRIPRESPLRYRATVYVRISRTGWLPASLLVSLVIGVVMFVARLKLGDLLEPVKGTPPGEAGTAATLLLALLGVIASWLTRPGEHPLAARLLSLVRAMILIDVAIVLTGTGDLLLHLSTHVLPTALWSGLAYGSAAVAFVIILSWLMPRQLWWRKE